MSAHAVTPIRRVLMTLDAVGGVWRHAIDAARGLAARDVSVLLVGQGPEPDDTQRAEAAAIPGCAMVWLQEPLDWLADEPRAVASVGRRLSALADSRNVGLLHLNLPSQAVGIAGGRPVVVMSHSCVVTWWQAVKGRAPLPAEWLWRLEANRAGFDRADMVLTPSRSHARALEASYGAIPRLRVVANATAPRSSAAKAPFVIASGRWWDEAKNAAVLDAAAPAIIWPVRSAGPVTRPHGQTVQFRHAEAVGPLSHTEMSSLTANAAILVSPSIYEPFGLAVLEAAAAGAALALADIPTFRELWTEAALFFDPRDPADLAVVVNRLACDAGLRSRLGRLARRRAQAFTLDRQADELMRAYRAAMAHVQGPLASVA